MRVARISYSDAEMTWLEANRMMVITDYHEAFCAEFDRKDVSANNLHGLRKRKRWLVGGCKGRTAGRSLLFSKAELSWLRENCTLELAAYHREFCKVFDRADITSHQLYTQRKNRKWKTGRTGQFEKGHVSANKGKPCPPGKMGNHPNARRTQFKKGQPRRGRAAEIYLPIGSERMHPSGYRERKFRDDGPMHRRWRFVHLLEWEKKYGPVPAGQCLKCLDGNRLNTDPDNWTLIARGVLPRLNGGRASGLHYDHVADELKPAVLTIAKIKHARSAQREKERA